MSPGNGRNGGNGGIRIGPGILAALVTLFLAFTGGVWSLSTAINGVNQRLDRNLVAISAAANASTQQSVRNCLALKDLAVLIRLHIIEGAVTPKSTLPMVDC